MTSYAAVVLAAGEATRFRAAGGRGPTKVLAALSGRPLIRHVVETVLRSRLSPAIVVLGHAAPAVEASLADLPIRFAINPDYASGLSSSLRTGLAAVPESSRGAIVVLGDMPAVAVETLDTLIARAEACPRADAVVPIFGGRRGNPVVLARSLFAPALRLTGDVGARRLLGTPSVSVEEVDCADAGILWDVDLPEHLPPSATSTAALDLTTLARR